MEEDAAVSIQRVGVDLEAPSTSTSLEFQCARIRRIENLDEIKGLKRLAIVANLLEKIENLDANTELESLDLYQNSITKIENIEHLKNLKELDISFNKIDRIENLNTLVNLRELYLSSNRISVVENLSSLRNLELLELGSNRIREYGDIRFLTNLTSLWLGRNKLTHMNLPALPKLTKCSLQNNRIREWDRNILENCPQLEELYLSFNGLTELPPFVDQMEKLVILDLGNNHISKIDLKGTNETIEEIWLNDNNIENEEDILPLQSLKNLRVLYLERNPVQAKLGPGYRNRILSLLPQLTQLDALPVVNRVN